MLNRNFKPVAANQAWVSDITYIRTRSGWKLGLICLFLLLIITSVDIINLSLEVSCLIRPLHSIASELESEGFGKPYRLMSGNGMHLYILLDDIVNNESNKALIENVLKLLSEKFNNDIVHVDTCVFNAARITKVPGTIASKGPNTADRPHRMAVVL